MMANATNAHGQHKPFFSSDTTLPPLLQVQPLPATEVPNDDPLAQEMEILDTLFVF